MSVINLRKRLERIEVRCHQGAPVRIMANRPLAEGEAAEAVANWRDWVADGRASKSCNVMWIMDPPMSVAEWAERFAKPDQRLN